MSFENYTITHYYKQNIGQARSAECGVSEEKFALHVRYMRHSCIYEYGTCL